MNIFLQKKYFIKSAVSHFGHQIAKTEPRVYRTSKVSHIFNFLPPEKDHDSCLLPTCETLNQEVSD